MEHLRVNPSDVDKTFVQNFQKSLKSSNGNFWEYF